jgi:uncharacterized membrane protein affecting hemolysin expression
LASSPNGGARLEPTNGAHKKVRGEGSMTSTLDTGVTAATDAAKPLSTLMRWSVLLLLAVGVLIAFVDRTSISSALGRGKLHQAFRHVQH